jgi:hypothetical protein
VTVDTERRVPAKPTVAGTVFSRSALRKTIPIALVVGTVLSLINQLQVILGGDATVMTWVRIGMNFVIPFIVSSAGFYAGELSSWRAEHEGNSRSG